MHLHANARTTPYARALIIGRVLKRAEPVKDTAAAFGISRQTVYKWLRRYRRFGKAGLQDRISRPRRMPTRTASELLSSMVRLRYQRLTAYKIAQRLRMAVSTVTRWLRRFGLGRLSVLDPVLPDNRYERDEPGELLHMDTKKLGRIERPGHRVHGDRSRRVRGAGWEFVHVVVDDHTRLAYAEVMATENQHDSTAFLLRALAWFEQHGIRAREVMTDNGAGYRSKRFNRACQKRKLRHLYTRPYTPRTNGKAERFIQTLTRRWAYGQAYQHSRDRTAALPAWLRRYNLHRPHRAIGMRPPIDRLRAAPCKQRA